MNTIIETPVVRFDHSASQVFDFLSDCQNIGRIMPKGMYSDWSASQNECSFILRHVARVDIKLKKKFPNEKVWFVSKSSNAISFDLYALISINEDNTCEGKIEFKSDLNPFVKMLAYGTLVKFFNELSQNLEKHFRDLPANH